MERHFRASVRNYKGLSSASVRSFPLLSLPAILAILVCLGGCSRQAEKLVGNERLIRGGAGLGATVRADSVADRDTYVDPGTVDFGSTLLVGRTPDLFEAKTLLAVSPKSWKVPDESQPGFNAQSVSFELTRDFTLGVIGLRVELHTSASVWDTTAISWPGPAPDSLLATADDDLLGTTFSLPLGADGYSVFKKWVADTTAPAGFILSAPLTQGVNAYKAGGAKIRVRYAHDVSGISVLDSIDTPMTQDFFIRAPLVSPTGADTTLVLGGLYGSELALHFPVAAIPNDASIDEATLVLNLAVGSSALDSTDVGEVVVTRIRSDWVETATQASLLNPDPVPFAARLLRLGYQKAEGRIAIRMPASILREWGGDPATNFGLLVTLKSRNFGKALNFASRESSRPPEITLTYTPLPPGRF